jgi:hypothetical protein
MLDLLVGGVVVVELVVVWWCLGLGVLLSLADGVDPGAVGPLGVGATLEVAVDVESGPASSLRRLSTVQATMTEHVSYVCAKVEQKDNT